MRVVSEYLYNSFVVETAEVYTMDDALENKVFFSHFKCARYATDVTLQQSNRPSGNMQEGKVYFSGKQKLSGLKVEVSVLRNGLAIECTKHYPGSTADVEIFYQNVNFHVAALVKSDETKQLPDPGILVDEYPDHRAVLMEKGYQGASEYVRAVMPRKKQPNRAMSLEDTTFNRRVSSDRIVVENYFGRMGQIWTVVSDKYRWSEGSYDSIFRTCLALTNMHVRKNPLRASDHQFFETVRNRLYCIGEDTVQEKKCVQERRRKRRKQRMDMRFRRMNGSGDEDSDRVLGF